MNVLPCYSKHTDALVAQILNFMKNYHEKCFLNVAVSNKIFDSDYKNLPVNFVHFFGNSIIAFQVKITFRQPTCQNCEQRLVELEFSG